MKPFTFLGMESDYGITLLSAVLILLAPAIRLGWDNWTITVKKKEVNHAPHTMVTGLLMLLFSFVNHWCYPQVAWWKGAVLSFGIFFLLFDYLLNISRGKKFFYIDQGLDGISSTSDGLYKKIGVMGTLFVKIWMAFFCFSIYFFASYINT